MAVHFVNIQYVIPTLGCLYLATSLILANTVFRRRREDQAN